MGEPPWIDFEQSPKTFSKNMCGSSRGAAELGNRAPGGLWVVLMRSCWGRGCVGKEPRTALHVNPYQTTGETSAVYRGSLREIRFGGRTEENPDSQLPSPKH